MGLIKSVFNKLSGTRKNVVSILDKLVKGQKIDNDTIMEIESSLIQTDMGSELVNDILSHIVKIHTDDYPSKLFDFLLNRFEEFDKEMILKKVVLVVGVNGTGKTTSIAKMANTVNVKNNVLLVAADTYRAAAVEQLERWSNRINVDFDKNISSIQQEKK